MEFYLEAYFIASFVGYLWLWRRGERWKLAYQNKPVQQIVRVARKPEPEPEDSRISSPTLADQTKALVQRMDRVGGRNAAEKHAYVLKKLHLRHPQLSYEQANKLIEQAL